MIEDPTPPDAPAGPPTARRLWWVLEPLHAVTYFAPESNEAYAAVGLKGFWMGYFAGRSACFGEASPEVVTATFFNFRPSMVHRALPDAWSFASPEAVLDARRTSAVAALRRLLGDDADGPGIAEAADLAEAAADACDPHGRALFAALASVDRPADPLERLWHAAGLLREHRGDGHNVANLAHGLDGLATHVTFSASGAVSRALLQQARGWTDDEWDAAVHRLQARGWLDGDGAPTHAGEAGRRGVEAMTDDLAARPWEVLGPEATDRLHELARPLARAIVAGGGVPAITPIGLPADR
jgi:hypothetical protein